MGRMGYAYYQPRYRDNRLERLLTGKLSGRLDAGRNRPLDLGPRHGGESSRPRYFSIRKLFFTENTPATPLACTFAIFLSASLATTPSSVKFPLFTMM